MLRLVRVCVCFMHTIYNRQFVFLLILIYFIINICSYVNDLAQNKQRKKNCSYC